MAILKYLNSANVRTNRFKADHKDVKISKYRYAYLLQEKKTLNYEQKRFEPLERRL